jgi:hypothetical protein
MNLLGFGKEKLSIVKDPFNKSSIEYISVVFRKKLFGGEWEAHGSVEFKNGQTEGIQKFKAESFDEVVLQMKEFINNL